MISVQFAYTDIQTMVVSFNPDTGQTGTVYWYPARFPDDGCVI